MIHFLAQDIAALFFVGILLCVSELMVNLYYNYRKTEGSTDIGFRSIGMYANLVFWFCVVQDLFSFDELLLPTRIFMVSCGLFAIGHFGRSLSWTLRDLVFYMLVGTCFVLLIQRNHDLQIELEAMRDRQADTERSLNHVSKLWMEC